MAGNANNKTKKAPPTLEVAHGLYGSAFDTSNHDEVGNAMIDWSELSEEERSFTLGHLFYLNLRVQAENGRLLRRVLQELEEINDVVQEVADDYFAEEEDPVDGEDEAEPLEEEARDEGMEDSGGRLEEGGPSGDSSSSQLERGGSPSEEGVSGEKSEAEPERLVSERNEATARSDSDAQDTSRPRGKAEGMPRASRGGRRSRGSGASAEGAAADEKVVNLEETRREAHE